MKQLIGSSILALSLSQSLVLAKDKPEPTSPKTQESHNVQYMPKGGYASTTGGHYVDPSVTQTIALGDKINNLTQRNLAGETIVQRLTDRTYWAQVGFYNVVFYVGNDSVLLFDALADGSGEAILKAIAKVTDKPISTLVYSHAHADHIADAAVFVNAAQRAGKTLRIIATDATAAKLDYLNSKLPKPTETVAFNQGTFTFENLTVQAQGFLRAAHTDDSAGWLLIQEKVMHAPDMTNPDQMAYLNFGGSENATYLEQNLLQLAQGDWNYFSGGHGNIGSKKDIQFMLTYFKDLKAAVSDAMTKISAGDYFTSSINNHAGAGHSWMQAISKHTVDLLRPKYGQYYSFEVSAPYQAELVSHMLESYK
jgi:glyoxylase-like metal-dependent hydrolase (beta-lactamase superfamily II)